MWWSRTKCATNAKTTGSIYLQAHMFPQISHFWKGLLRLLGYNIRQSTEQCILEQCVLLGNKGEFLCKQSTTYYRNNIYDWAGEVNSTESYIGCKVLYRSMDCRLTTKVFSFVLCIIRQQIEYTVRTIRIQKAHTKPTNRLTSEFSCDYKITLTCFLTILDIVHFFTLQWRY
jgi:hypothetical protein